MLSFSHLVDGIQQPPPSRPLHCIKLLTQSKASVVVTVSYSNMTDDVYANEYEYNGDQSKHTNTICETLPMGFDNAKIYKAEIEQVESSDDVWQSTGVLLQESPSGVWIIFEIWHLSSITIYMMERNRQSQRFNFILYLLQN